VFAQTYLGPYWSYIQSLLGLDVISTNVAVPATLIVGRVVKSSLIPRFDTELFLQPFWIARTGRATSVTTFLADVRATMKQVANDHVSDARYLTRITR
jgi:hypothetical protein